MSQSNHFPQRDPIVTSSSPGTSVSGAVPSSVAEPHVVVKDEEVDVHSDMHRSGFSPLPPPPIERESIVDMVRRKMKDGGATEGQIINTLERMKAPLAKCERDRDNESPFVDARGQKLKREEMTAYLSRSKVVIQHNSLLASPSLEEAEGGQGAEITGSYNGYERGRLHETVEIQPCFVLEETTGKLVPQPTDAAGDTLRTTLAEIHAECRRERSLEELNQGVHVKSCLEVTKDRYKPSHLEAWVQSLFWDLVDDTRALGFANGSPNCREQFAQLDPSAYFRNGRCAQPARPQHHPPKQKRGRNPTTQPLPSFFKIKWDELWNHVKHVEQEQENWTRWTHYSSSGGFLPPQISPGGAGTASGMAYGVRLWFVWTRDDYGAPRLHVEVLCAGDTIAMPPGIMYQAYTPVPTIMAGLYFYSYDLMSMTERRRREEFWIAGSGANYLPGSARRLFIMGLTLTYRGFLMDRLLTLNRENISALTRMLRYPQSYWPNCPPPQHGDTFPWLLPENDEDNDESDEYRTTVDEERRRLLSLGEKREDAETLLRARITCREWSASAWDIVMAYERYKAKGHLARGTWVATAR